MRGSPEEKETSSATVSVPRETEITQSQERRLLSLGGLKDYWKDISDAIAPMITEAKTLDPAGFEQAVNEKILPAIYGEGTQVRLVDVLGIDAMTESASDYIGRNFRVNEGDSPERGQIIRSVFNMHQNFVDEDGHIVVPIVFERETRNDYDDSLTPVGYKIEDYVSPVTTLGREFNSWFSGFYIGEPDPVGTEAPQYVPTLGENSYPLFQGQKMVTVPQSLREQAVTYLTSNLDVYGGRVTNPNRYLETTNNTYFPQLIVHTILRPKDSDVDFSAYYRRGGIPSVQDINYAEWNSYQKQSRNSIVYATPGDVNVAAVLHEFLHKFRNGHPHENPTILAESKAIARAIGDPFGPSILNYGKLVNPNVGEGRNNPDVCYFRPHDQLFLGIAEYCVTDAVEHGAIPDLYPLYRDKFDDFVKIDTDLESLGRPVNSGRRIFANSLKNFAAIEAPVAAVEIALEKMSETYPRLKASAPIISIASRLALTSAINGPKSAVINFALNVGVACLASDDCQKMIKTCAEKSGIDQTWIGQKLEEAHKKYHELPQSVRSFVEQFVTTFALVSVAEIFAERAINLPGGRFATYAYQAAESHATAALTAAAAATFKGGLKWAVGSAKNQSAVASEVNDEDQQIPQNLGLPGRTPNYTQVAPINLSDPDLEMQEVRKEERSRQAPGSAPTSPAALRNQQKNSPFTSQP